jgi:hypothetical protein
MPSTCDQDNQQQDTEVHRIEVRSVQEIVPLGHKNSSVELGGYYQAAGVVLIRLLYSSDCVGVTAVLMLFLFLTFHCTRLATLILFHFVSRLLWNPPSSRRNILQGCISVQGFFRRVSIQIEQRYLAVIISRGRPSRVPSSQSRLNNTSET